ncbi:valine--tRNA ligase [Luteimonas aquatica]|uniref:valine--tRNA ligase n=1 Tax=Luteimonas aquatica TaxID=450364 RepID=UPI001F597FF2|nr:valine--tRNA ligase [Luteimonas aquatica]
MTQTLAPGYDPKQFETRLYAEWEGSGVFAPQGDGPAYSILLPPPNVTGTLHMGHAFQHTLMDALVRYHRMRGYRTLWQMGSDHAGIATEMVVARNLGRDGLTRDGLGRERFIEKVWEWKGQSGDTIERQMRRLGASGDWSRSVFTMDPMPSAAVVEAFVRLHEAGLIYRGQRLVNWDPVLKTAISDLEVVNEEEDGFLWSIDYPLVDGRQGDGSATLTVATTRPETMLGDTAVMVHPEDERYAHLIGKRVRLPLTGREIPIIADAYVDREFGTGVVKVTPAHDFNDYAVGQRHGLPMINIFTPEAAVNDNAPERYRGLDRFAARKTVLADLEAEGRLAETKPHKLQVPRGDRTNQVIEPYLTDQWFVKMDDFAARGLALAEQGQVRFVPPNWINTYRHWMENIQDWCISRQLWWGHRIPAWYSDAGKPYVARDEAGARALAQADGYEGALSQDADVLETWFSSALWPLSTMGWPDADAMQARGFDRFVPSSVLVTGFDIIFFWVARMIMMTDRLLPAGVPDAGRVPFKDVYMTGLVRDKDGQKMSKSKGNILDPLDLIDGITLDDLLAKRTSGLMQPKMAEKIEKATRKEFPQGIPAFGADALRFTMAALAGPGRDIKFDLARCEGYKNFCNKLWNATRFVLMNTEGFSAASAPEAAATDAERWILARLAKTAAEAEAHFAAYRFDLLAQTLYEFAWNEFCDWFVELAKPALNGDDATAADSTRRTLLFVLERMLCLLHPLVPFVTEELWQQVAPRLGVDGRTVMLQRYPHSADFAVQAYGEAEADIEWLKAMVSALRRIRSELGVSPTRSVRLLTQGGDAEDAVRLARHASQLKFLNRLDGIEAVAGEVPPAAAALVGTLKLLVPLEGLVDLDAERARLDKELKRVAGEQAKSQGKLASDTFVQNAPAAVVEQERKRLADWTAQLETLAAQRARLGAP